MKRFFFKHPIFTCRVSRLSYSFCLRIDNLFRRIVSRHLVTAVVTIAARVKRPAGHVQQGRKIQIVIYIIPYVLVQDKRIKGK